MVYIPPPHLADERPSYLEAYNGIVSAHRRSPLTAASSVVMLVTPNVDALCASRMLATLFKQDDVVYRIVPVSSLEGLEDVRDELQKLKDLHTLILIEMGGQFDLPLAIWFVSLANLFMGGDHGRRIVVWDDGELQKLDGADGIKESWEIAEYEPDPRTSEDSDHELEEDFEEDDENNEEEDDDDGGEDGYSSDPGSTSNKRRRGSKNSSNKRQRKSREQQQRKMTIDEYDEHKAKVRKYYDQGGCYGQSVAGSIYSLATVLERVDNDFLWLAILGLTFQYITSRISRERYEGFQTVYFDEVSRLNPQPAQNDNAHSLLSINPDDISVRSSEELRFMLFRHWTLYDAMYHSNYVASKLGIWKEKGRQRLTGLLARMGFSIPQAQQPYSHMDMDLKRDLIQKLNDEGPEQGLVELTYPSFIRCYGFHTQPLSAADAVEGISALLDVAEGTRMEVEIEGMRNGGEWFGAGRIWEVRTSEQNESARKQITEHAPKPNGATTSVANGETQDPDQVKPQEPAWWIKNFWTAYDALSDVAALRRSLNLAMSLQRAIIRTGTSIIDKQDIKTTRNHRVVVLTQGPDLPLFSHVGILTRLALWLVDALRDRIRPVGFGAKKKSLPFVVACLNEAKHRYTVVGVTAAVDFGEVRKNQFAKTFIKAMEACHVDDHFSSFDTSVIEVDEKDLKIFLDTLCNT